MRKIPQSQYERMTQLIVDDIYRKIEHDSYTYIAAVLSPYITTDPINVLKKMVQRALVIRLKQDKEFGAF
jgi:uncharacterized protein (UPF0297 family)